MSGDDRTTSGGREEVGSVGEEAIKLLAALQGWAKEHGEEYGAAATAAASTATAGLRAIDEHIATGGKECRYCPICQVISAVRHTSPEVKAHLVTAATSFMHAVAGIMATHVPESRGGREPGVEKIDLDDVGADGEDEEPWD